MRHGVRFDVRHRHERAHVAPLAKRLGHLRARDASAANVIVSADTRPPVRGAWNIQVFHGLGDKGYTGNPVFLQKGRWPRLRTAMNVAMRSVGLPAHWTRPPADAGCRPSRYEQVNAYGPYFRDLFEDMLKDVVISEHGHVALNERGRYRVDGDGPLLWLPTWDNRRYMGGSNQSSLARFAHEIALVSRHVPVRVKYHPLTLLHGQDAAARAELAKEPGVEVVDARADPYDLLDGTRAVLTDTSSLGFEAYCMGIPVGVARPPGVAHRGLHASLATRVHILSAGRPDLLAWAEAPERPSDAGWIRDLLYAPSPGRNDAFAASIESRVARH